MTSNFNNASLSEMGEKLLMCDSFAICGHQNPDGDCLGSQLGLAWALRSMGKQVDCLLVEDAPVEFGLRFLPGIDEMIPAAEYDKTPDAFIAVDISEEKRLGAGYAVMQRCPQSFCVDHHPAKSRIADYLYSDPSAAAACMLVWDLIGEMGIEPNADVAQCLYTGLMTDTGRFQFQNADAKSFRYAADMIDAGADVALSSTEFFQNRRLQSYLLERDLIDHLEMHVEGVFAFSFLTLDNFAEADAVKADAETAIDVLRSLTGVRVACVLKEHADCIRGSFRAKDDTNVAAFAEHFGGGGHKAAAGFTMYMPLEEAKKAVVEYVVQQLSCEAEGSEVDA